MEKRRGENQKGLNVFYLFLIVISIFLTSYFLKLAILYPEIWETIIR